SFALITNHYSFMYDKQAFTIDEQIKQLKRRGLIISSSDNAEHYLSNISYYRLAGYWWPMQDDKINDIFKTNSTICDVISLYNFDRELRLLIFNFIEKLEIASANQLWRLIKAICGPKEYRFFRRYY